MDKVWFTSSNQTVASEGFTVTGWLDVVHQPNNLEVNPPCWEAQRRDQKRVVRAAAYFFFWNPADPKVGYQPGKGQSIF